MPNLGTLDVAGEVRLQLAGSALTERQAKLYSQRLHLNTGQDGLPSFTADEFNANLDEAMLLLQCALMERQANLQGPWRQSLKRGAEILEWLSQRRMKEPGTPLHLLSAAAYQLAGYPAMALGQLLRDTGEEQVSVLLREFLRANFPGALGAISTYWRGERARAANSADAPRSMSALAARHVVMCIGTICSALKTGRFENSERALKKLEQLASGYLHSRDHFSYFLARLTAATAGTFLQTSLWPAIESLQEGSSEAAGAALKQFVRSAFVNRRILVWPAQIAGIERLRGTGSFVLCTPTGSGKTTVATLAIVQGLFADSAWQTLALDGMAPGNLVLYLMPSRALAAEVEVRLQQDLNGIASQSVVVTGLYGGIDWGPTDAWIQRESATILVCTFEKADALIRYLGVLFLNRVRLVVIDEAHMVEQPEALAGNLLDGSSRPFKLEQLGTRLLRARESYDFRIVALSAVAARSAPAMARWIEGDPDAQATTSMHRSTRQMLGRLEVSPQGNFNIRYDLMDGRSLQFREGNRNEKPYVRNPFPPLPGGLKDDGPDIRMRAPTLWAALHLAAEQPDGLKPSVLISLTQNIDTFATDCASFMDHWSTTRELPNYNALSEDNVLWSRCLASAADYFTTESVEYRLLRHGIAVHHGKMPNLLSRRLKVMIDQGLVRVIIATSTLSEGVNLPVNFLLIPSVCRAASVLSLQEFTNLIGRAGRPGVSTEGSALVVLPEPINAGGRTGRSDDSYNRQKSGYTQLISQVEAATGAASGSPQDKATSGLALLLSALQAAWTDMTGQKDDESFAYWLEQTVVPPAAAEEEDAIAPAYAYLDSLDAFLIAAIQEVEELRSSELSAQDMEAELIKIWRKTYAFASNKESDRLSVIWLKRGKAIKARYPDAKTRRQIYRTSLSPRSAKSLLDIQETLKAKLNEGVAYARWTAEQRLAFIRDTLLLLAGVPAFRIGTALGKKKLFTDWPTLLRWWLAKSTLNRQPKSAEITQWYQFVAQNFIFRGTWGLGSILGLLLDLDDEDGPVKALEISDWPRSGLPWVAFWIKELITWGTLDPVAAFLLARGDALDRPTAEEAALGYYASLPADMDSNDMLDPQRIGKWMNLQGTPVPTPTSVPDFSVAVQLAQPAASYREAMVVVTPLGNGTDVAWVDPGGYEVARSTAPFQVPMDSSAFEFDLRVGVSQVECRKYQRHL